MNDLTIWHNPRCSKSRQTLALLQERGLDPTVVDYRNAPPTVSELKAVLAKLGLEPIDIMRIKDALFAELGLSKSDSAEHLIAQMAAHPMLIERPIVISGDKARVGRPPEAVLEIL